MIFFGILIVFYVSVIFVDGCIIFHSFLKEYFLFSYLFKRTLGVSVTQEP